MSSDVTGRALVLVHDADGTRRETGVGTVGPAEWGSMFGPFDGGEPIPYDELPLVTAVRQGHPAHANFEIRSTDGATHLVEASAFPILTPHGSQGAIAIFWPTSSTPNGNGAGPA